MCFSLSGYNCSELIRTKKFWVILIVFLSLFAVFITIGSIFVRMNQDYVNHQKAVYTQINVTVDEYSALTIPCKCETYYGSNNPNKDQILFRTLPTPRTTCSWNSKPYTGVIIVKYSVENDTYYDEKRVVCGDTYNQAISNAIQNYPKSKPILMYYATNDPDGGVVFKPNFNGPYWMEILICFFTGSLCLGISLLAFWPTKKSESLVIRIHGSDSWNGSGESENGSNLEEQKLLLGDK